jgi:hypothetical protein
MERSTTVAPWLVPLVALGLIGAGGTGVGWIGVTLTTPTARPSTHAIMRRYREVITEVVGKAGDDLGRLGPSTNSDTVLVDEVVIEVGTTITCWGCPRQPSLAVPGCSGQAGRWSQDTYDRRTDIVGGHARPEVVDGMHRGVVGHPRDHIRIGVELLTSVTNHSRIRIGNGPVDIVTGGSYIAVDRVIPDRVLPSEEDLIGPHLCRQEVNPIERLGAGLIGGAPDVVDHLIIRLNDEICDARDNDSKNIVLSF